MMIWHAIGLQHALKMITSSVKNIIMVFVFICWNCDEVGLYQLCDDVQAAAISFQRRTYGESFRLYPGTLPNNFLDRKQHITQRSLIIPAVKIPRFKELSSDGKMENTVIYWGVLFGVVYFLFCVITIWYTNNHWCSLLLSQLVLF